MRRNRETWVVSDSPFLNQIDYGLLRIERDDQGLRRWHVAGCDGRELASGVRIVGSLDERMLMSSADEPSAFPWPGLDAPQGVALLHGTSLSSISVRLLSLRDQVTQWVLAMFARRANLVVEKPENVRMTSKLTLQVAGGLPVRVEMRRA